ncbi:glycosyltransferase [Salegentibacter mishustinae]|uniref:Glycosyl transferase family 1 domain-containing protein n=1 Tax=Salegentibacter mishustinae TaxID=270918 RepID=A0A0Q9Z877_9FLAO|nr:glycosyltransferase [Salegentibacter mishustinae]KRG29163.1 hypothetical protein APR42_04325 [Salegentibacter mishustinae]PNW21785.1 hypothetical protein APB85_11160 [Salegentibacter mishustinae]PZX65128.1 colanic acid/amylovoran biosynthesis glycosyltransferase [Salegentibacter mishustinae]GGW87152.1 colanic acid biosynthesis glycosyltransferase WcaL [Salegentibacter mishustinae]
MKKKLRILFIVGSFPTLSQTFIVNQIIHLLRQGHDVKIIAKNHTKNSIQEQVEKYELLKHTHYVEIPENLVKRLILTIKTLLASKRNFRWKLIQSFNPLLYKRQAVNLVAFFKVCWTLKFPNNFDIVHTHFAYNTDLFFMAKKAGFLQDAKLITSFHGFDMVPSDVTKNKKRYKELFDNQTLLTTNNEYGKFLIQKIKPGYSNISILPVSLDTALFEPKTIEGNNTFRIVFCGRLTYWKGPHLVVEIANQLINNRKIRNIEFEIIGDGEERIKLERLIEEYNLRKFINVHGALTQGEIKQIFNKSKIFVLPGLTDKNGRAETQGLVVQEAQAMALPVLVSDAGGAKYGLQHNETGYVLPEGDVSQFCNKIEYLITNPLFRMEMGQKGRDFVVQNFDIQVLGEKLEEIYYQNI